MFFDFIYFDYRSREPNHRKEQKMLKLRLQRFSEEAAGAESQPATDTAGAGEAGEQVAPVDADQGMSFDDLIKSNPEYEKALGEHVANAISKRFKNQKDLQSRIDEASPIIEMMAEKYGVRPDDKGAIDLAMLQQKILDDNSMYEQEAFDRGMDVEDLKHYKKVERENAYLRRKNEDYEKEAESRKEFEALMAQGEELKKVYPNFSLGEELSNPDFGRLIASKVPLRTAYEVVHKDEILAGGMQYAVQQTAQKISNSIQSGHRPTENGLSGKAPASGKIDPSKLSKKEIDEIMSRVAAGERITF